jgi:purine-binding chemotaxis protein CheW
MDIAKIRKKLKDREALSAKREETEDELKITEHVEVEEVRTTEREAPAVKREEKETPDASHVTLNGDIIEILTFSLLKEEFALRVSQLEEILRPQRITMVPKMPDYVMGITSLRGKIIPVIDLKTKLSLIDKPSDINPRGKILIIKGPKGPIGAEIDKIIGVVRIAKSEIIPPPSHLTEAEHKFIEGVTVVDKRFISIIQMEEAIKIELS